MFCINGFHTVALRHIHDQLLYHTRALMGVTDVHMLSDEYISYDRISHPIRKECHVSSSYHWYHRNMIALHSIFHVSNSTSNVFKFVGNICNFMPSAYQTLTQLISVSLDSSEFGKGEIGAHQYAVFVFAVHQIIQVIDFVVFVKIFMFANEIADVDVWTQVKADMLGSRVLAMCLILNFV